jgi:predicted house-cleaning noncanonical NTP pyrophosphatase (MazG superfamily)
MVIPYGKLVRDKVIEVIIADGYEPDYYVLDERQFLLELAFKGVEEMNELFRAVHATDMAQTIEEFGDTLQVLQTLGEVLRLTSAQMSDVMRKKCEDKGAYNKHHFLVKVTKAA